MDLGIAGKWALVCGASKGLGFGCARALAQEGVNLVINARNPEALQEAAASLSALAPQVKVLAVAADITTEEGRAAVLAAAGGPGVDFDIVVTNAGGPPPGDFRDWDRAAWIKAVDANMLTPIELIKATVSNGARSGLTGFVAGLARSGIAARGVTINNLLPGKFDTDRLRTTFSAAASKTGKSLDDVRLVQQSQVPARRFGTPDEFGAICAFLCSVHAGYMTGQNILPDGGLYAGTF
jgi:3-oxoacyl-[acyl-carrier protein] reductase